MVQLAYIGLGNIGSIVAGHIADHLEKIGEPALLVYNRSISKSEALVAEGKRVKVATLDEIAQADIILSCLFNDAAVESILGDQLIGAGKLKRGAIVVEQATIRPETAVQVAARAAEHGVVFLTCPVMGAPPRAKAQLLVPLLAGPAAQRAIVRPYLENVIGKVIVEVGDDVGAALRLKLCGNYLVISMIEMIAEALTLGETSGVGQDKVRALIDGLFANTPFADYSQRMVDETYDDVRFSLEGAEKDSTYILDLAKTTGASIPTAEIFKSRLQVLQAQKPNADISGIVGVVREASGLPFDLKEKKQ